MSQPSARQGDSPEGLSKRVGFWLGLVLFAVILALTLFQRKVVEKRVHYA